MAGASERFRKWGGGYKFVRTLYNLVVKVFAENFDISRIFDLAGTGGTSPELGGYNVPRGLLHTGHRCCRQAASQVSHTATDGGPPTSAIHCRTPSIRCARPRGLELSAG